MFAKNFRNKNKGLANKEAFSLVELVVVIAILGVLTVVLAPSLLRYVEESRARRDRARMDAVCTAIQAAMSDEDVLYEMMAFTCSGNYSCYIDIASETAAASNKEIYGDSPSDYKTAYGFTDKMREKDETPYYVAGNMRGVTITFQPRSEGKSSYAYIREGIINKFVGTESGNVAASSTNNVVIASGRDADDIEYHFGEAPNLTMVGTFKNMTADGLTHCLFEKVFAEVGEKVELTSRQYRNSEYTVFIQIPAISKSDEMIGNTVKAYGQWNGTNLEYTEPEKDNIIPCAHEEVWAGKIDAHTKCKNCGIIMKDGEYHVFFATPNSPGNCKEKGTTIYTCECGYSYEKKNDNLGPHSPVPMNNAVAPTCIEKGKETDIKCSICDITLEVGPDIPPLGHDVKYTVGPLKPDGTKDAVAECTRCHTTLNIKIPKEKYTYNGTRQGDPLIVSSPTENEFKITYGKTQTNTTLGTQPQYKDAFDPAVSVLTYFKIVTDNDMTVTNNFPILIEKAHLTVTNLNQTYTYDANPHGNPISVTSPVDGTQITVKYGVASGSYTSTSTPKITYVKDSKTIYYKVTAENHFPVEGQYQLEITKRPLTLTWPTTTSWTYDGEWHTVECTIGNVCPGDEIKLGYENNSIRDADTKKATVLGITGTKNHDNYYLPTNTTCDITVERAVAIIKAGKEPTAKDLTYNGTSSKNGTEQVLINAGDTDNQGTMYYALSSSGSGSSSLPTGTNAGEYTVYYWIHGDSNHKDSAKKSLKVTIKRADMIANITNGQGICTDGGTIGGAKITFTKATDATIKYGTASGSYPDSEIPKQQHGKHTIYIQATAANFNTYTGSLTITIDHADPVLSGNTAATCSRDGLKDRTVCSVCGTQLNAGTVLSALGHTGDSGNGSIIKPATCKDPGTKFKKCTRNNDGIICGENYGSVELPALGHTGDTKTGLIIQSVTCENPGKRYKQCTRCNTDYDLEHPYVYENAWGHDYGSWTKYDGTYHRANCKKCNSTCGCQSPYQQNQHNMGDWTITKAATCSATGTRTKKCQQCTHSITEDIPKTAHIAVASDRTATCTTKGTSGRTVCSVCGVVITAGTDLGYGGHSWGKKDAVGHACKNPKGDFICTYYWGNDHMTYLDHDFGGYLNIGGGKHKRICRTCGYEEIESCTSGSYWYSDGDGHYHCCISCGASTGFYYHSYVGTKCTTCGYIKKASGGGPSTRD